jgi:hypothetical protein
MENGFYYAVLKGLRVARPGLLAVAWWLYGHNVMYNSPRPPESYCR